MKDLIDEWQLDKKLRQPHKWIVEYNIGENLKIENNKKYWYFVFKTKCNG